MDGPSKKGNDEGMIVDRRKRVREKGRKKGEKEEERKRNNKRKTIFDPAKRNK